MAAKDRVPSLLYTPCSRQFRLCKEGTELAMDKRLEMSKNVAARIGGEKEASYVAC